MTDSFSEEKKYALSKPFVVIASQVALDNVRIEKYFRRHGMECIFVQTPVEMIEKTFYSGCFCVFLDDDFCPNTLNIVKELKKRTKCAWVFCLRENFGKTISHQAIASGASLVVFRPTEPEQYFQRAKQMLSIYKMLGKPQVIPQQNIAMKAIRSLGLENESSEPASMLMEETFKEAQALEYSWQQQVIQQKPIKDNAPKRLSFWIEEDQRTLYEKDFIVLPKKNEEVFHQMAWSKIGQEFKNLEFESLNLFAQKIQTLLTQLSGDESCELSFVSFRPQSPAEECSKFIRLLCRNNSSFAGFEKLRILKDFPELAYCLDQSQPVLVINADQALIYDSKPRSENAMSIAAIPLIENSSRIVGLLRVCFSSNDLDVIRKFINDLFAFSNFFLPCFRQLEFFSRIYSADSGLYSVTGKTSL